MRAGPKQLSLISLDNVAGNGEFTRNDLSKHIQCPMYLLVGSWDVQPLYKFRNRSEIHKQDRLFQKILS